MDAITLLTGDHQRVRGIVKRLEAAEESRDDETMRQLADQLFKELETHTTLEEEIFYPAVREASDDLAELIEESLQEHHVVDVLIGEARDLEPGSDEWTAKLSVIVENVEHHAGEEEEELFPQARSALGDELDALGERLTAKKRDLGAPTADQVIDLPKEELMERARAQEIPGRSSMSQEELAASIDPR